MTQLANRVYNDSAEIANLEILVARLPSEARVRLHLRDGRQLEATVPERPTVQVFEDIRGNQGMNGVLRVEIDDTPHYLWLDEIDKVDLLHR